MFWTVFLGAVSSVEMDWANASKADYRVSVCTIDACDHGNVSVVHLPAGSSLRGSIHDLRCVRDGGRQLTAPQLNRSQSNAGRCPLSSFVVRLDGPAIYTPRVHVKWGSEGRYEFHADVAEPGSYTLDVRLDFAGDAGLCGCNAARSVILFQHLLTARVEVAAMRGAARKNRSSDHYLPRGRWLRTNCSAGGRDGAPHSIATLDFMDAACAVTGPPRALIAGYWAAAFPPSSPRWLYAHVDGERRRVLPFDFVPAKGSFWLHVLGDSTVMRGEKEDLVLLLNNGSSAATRAQRVRCIDVPHNRTSEKVEACGNPRALGVGKLSMGLVNLLEFELPGGRTLHVSYSVGGSTLNPGDEHFRRCVLDDNGVSSARHQGCEHHTGVGAEYWRRLFGMGGALTGHAQPGAPRDKLARSSHARNARLAHLL